jgi:hypothetical protein
MPMMRVRLAYGTTGPDIGMDPELATTVEPVHHLAADPRTWCRQVLKSAARYPSIL